MTAKLRHPRILDIARREGSVTVEDLARRLGVTLQTVRRDLRELARDGRLQRVHGGAVLPAGLANIAYEERRALNAAGKEAMAAACLAEIPEDASLFLNIGTSTEALARALMARDRLMVVTNNLNVASTLSAHPGAEVIVTGGRLRAADGGLVGSDAAQGVSRYKLDLAVIGCSAIDADGDLLDFDPDEVAVSREILSRARRVFLLADHSKFQRHAHARIASLRQIDHLFTDAPLPDALARLCHRVQIRVTVCPPPGGGRAALPAGAQGASGP